LTHKSADDHRARTLVLGLSLAQLVSWGSALYSFAVFVGPVEAALGATRAQTSLAFSLALLAEGLRRSPSAAGSTPAASAR